MRQDRVRCKSCGKQLKKSDAEWHRGWGRLCSDCDSRATVVTDVDGRAIRVSIAPKAQT